MLRPFAWNWLWIPSLTNFKTVMWHLKVLIFDLHLWDKLQLSLPPQQECRKKHRDAKRRQRLSLKTWTISSIQRHFLLRFQRHFLPILFNRCNLLFKITASNPYYLCMIKIIWENKYWFVPLEGGVTITAGFSVCFHCPLTFSKPQVQPTQLFFSRQPTLCFLNPH